MHAPRRRGFVSLARAAAAMLLTYVFVQTTWVFFRAADFGVAARMLERMFVAPFTGDASGVHVSLRYAVLLVPLVILHVSALARESWHLRTPYWLRGVGAGLMLVALFVVRRGEARDFVYFQF